MKLGKIELIFENCDCVEYEYGKDFRYFDVGDVTVTFRHFSNGIHKYLCVEGFTLILTKDADIEGLTNDVTQLLLTYQDDTTELYLVKLPDGDQYWHSGQNKRITANGNTLFTSTCGSYIVDERWEDDGEIDTWCYYRGNL